MRGHRTASLPGQSPAIPSRDGACFATEWCCLTMAASCFRTAEPSPLLPRIPRPPESETLAVNDERTTGSEQRQAGTPKQGIRAEAAEEEVARIRCRPGPGCMGTDAHKRRAIGGIGEARY